MTGDPAGRPLLDDDDVELASIARCYDYWVGGKDNYAVDRELAVAIETLAPEVPRAARANRAFLARIVRHLADQGHAQFLDLGSGLPTSPNVHEITRRAVPGARTVYVDRDPVVAAHARARLGRDEGVTVLQEDVRDVAAVMGHPAVGEALDLARPVVVLMLAVLHFVGDDQDPAALVKAYVDHLAPGSVVVVSHATTLADIAPWTRTPEPTGARRARRSRTSLRGEDDGAPAGPPTAPAPGPGTARQAQAVHAADERVKAAAELYSQYAAPITLRSIPQVKALMGQLVLDSPGVVPAHAWFADPVLSYLAEDDATVLVAVGRVPR